MGYQLIEWLGGPDDTHVVEIDGSTFPLPSLVEDPEGIRILLTYPDVDLSIPRTVWHQAHTHGAAAIIGSIGLGEWLYQTAERFMESREEGYLDVPVYVTGWQSLTSNENAPTYRDILHAEEGQGVTSGPDPWAPPFVHVHTHSEFSPPDGFSKVTELVDIVTAQGGPALGLADHGSCAGHVALQQACDEAGIKPLFAMEAYFQDDRHIHDKTTRYAYWHLVLVAMNDVGLKNLWALSTEGYVDGWYDGKARIDWDTLERHQEGLIATTACLRGPVAQPLLDGREEQARINLARLQGIFDDRLYIEIHTNQLDKQRKVNETMVRWGEEMSIPLIAAVDSHYPCADDYLNHQAMLVLRNKKASIQEATSEEGSEGGMFADSQDYSMLSGDQVAAALEYLGPAVVETSMANTVRLAERCTAKIVPDQTIPVFSKATEEWPDPRAHDYERMVEVCLGNWDRKIKGKNYSEELAIARLNEEFGLIDDKDFPGYFLVVRDYVWAAKHRDQLDPGVLDIIESMIPMPVGGYRRTPILVGPGRGSGGGSLVAYLMDITEIDPLEADLLFARFMTPGRKELPDFDLDFPATERDWIKAYVRWRWGDDHVITIGTVGRMQVKAAVGEVVRVFANQYNVAKTDSDRMTKIAGDMAKGLAGAALKWEDFAEEEDVKAYAAKYPEVWELSSKFYGRWRAYGQHPAGVVISTDEPLTGTLPLRVDKNGNLVCQFDMEEVGFLGKVKFDLLTVRNLDTVQECIDLVDQRYGVRIDPYEWHAEHDDPLVWEEISAGHTRGMFQVNTTAGTKMVKRIKPKNMQDMAIVITLVRPGPQRSGLTETYIKRRDGNEEVSVPDPRLEPVLADTYGCLIFQEDIMATTMVLANYDGTEADGVRKILGKKQVEKVEAAGRVFIARSVENHTDQAVVEALWEQMAEFAKYSFNKAHAYGYSVLAYWTAWFKVHFALEFLTAALSTVDDDEIPDFVREARREGYQVLPPDINISGMGFTPDGLTIRYGLNGVKGVGPAAVDAILPHQPFATFDDFEARRGPKCDSGKVKLLVRVGAFDSLVPNRRALESHVLWETSGESRRCAMRDDDARNVNDLPCTFDWSSEPLQIGKSGRPLKPKDPPKKCTVKCRQYIPTGAVDTSVVQPYNDADVRDIEKELLGIHLTTTVFDQFAEDDRKAFAKVEEIESGPLGEYITGGIIARVSDERMSTGGNPFAFIKLETETGVIEFPAFGKTWAKYKPDLRTDALMMVIVEKNNRGLTLQAAAPPRGN